MSEQCYAKLKVRTKIEVLAPENDYSLMSKCASVIQVRDRERNSTVLTFLLLTEILRDGEQTKHSLVLETKLQPGNDANDVSTRSFASLDDLEQRSVIDLCEREGEENDFRF